jgi:hypothetical protein
MKGEGRGEEKEKVQKGLPSFECPRRFAGNFASVLLALGEKSKRQPSVNTLLYWLFGMKKKGLYSSEGYNRCFLALRDAERGKKCKQKTTHNLAPVGIRQKLSFPMGLVIIEASSAVRTVCLSLAPLPLKKRVAFVTLRYGPEAR